MRTLINATIKIDGTDVSNQGNKVNVAMSAEELDGTGFQTEFKQTEPGLKTAGVEMTLFQSFGEGSVNTLLAGLFKEGKAVLVTVTPKEGVISADNPAFALVEGKMFGYTPVGGDGPGQLMTTDAKFENVGQQGVIEITKPEDLVALEGE